MREIVGQAKVRDAMVAGIFYPDSPAELEERIKALLAAARPSVSAAEVIVSPHAGLDYAGDLTALAWKSALGRQVDTVIAISPLHRAEECFIYLPESDYYEIPTGKIEVDHHIVDELSDCGTLMNVNDIPHLEEHGIEVQLPFMLQVFPEARLVPILVGFPTPALVKALASALELVLAPRKESTLILISSDLGSSSDDQEAGEQADFFLHAVMAKESKAILAGLESGKIAACGAACMAAYLESSLARNSAPVLLGRHDSSASRETGEEKLVHYAALSFQHG